MNLSRRTFLGGAASLPILGARTPTYQLLDPYFLPILDGFLKNARRTSDSFAVCDFPDGTMLPGSLARSGKTYDSVSRMMPSLGAWAAGGRQERREEVLDALTRMFRNAFDPKNPDFWLSPTPGRANQRQVESSIVAWTLWVLGDPFLSRLTSRDRANIQAWLASCTQCPVRHNNWAWFTAVNHAVRLSLAGRWKEFSGDAGWMIEDLKALDSLAAPGDGWYTDSRSEPVYDYYNFWVFASHFLYWNRIIGKRYPEWQARFQNRLHLFLEKTPYFFGSNGSHILYGRSLIYRFAVLTPLVLAYEQKLWPHSPGLLRRIVRGNLDFHWKIGAFDEQRGKLRETYSTAGNPEIRDSYIDNGHPYWGMQAFALFLIPPDDPFWNAPEEPLPVERGDFRVRFEPLQMLLTGDKSSGQVQWLQALAARGGADHRDKYTKFSYSSHFPFNILKRKDRAAWDSALIFRDPKTGACASRAGVRRGDLTEHGLETDWYAELDGKRLEVTSRIETFGEFERRTHTILVPADSGFEAIEGSYPLGLEEGEECESRQDAGWRWIRSPRSGHVIVSWNVRGYGAVETATSFEESERKNVNVISPRMVVNTLRAKLRSGKTVFESLHYASPKPLPRNLILKRGTELATA